MSNEITGPAWNVAAQRLLQARRSGRTLEEMRLGLPQTLALGYEVQNETVRLRGEPIVAFKVGMTNPRAQRVHGTSEPIVGRLIGTDVVRSPARIGVNRVRYVEAEVIFELGRDLPSRDRPYTTDQIATAVCAAHAGIEVCASRFRDDDVPLASLVADNSNAEFLVIGDALTTEFLDVSRQLPAILTRRGRTPVEGSTSQVLGHPLHSLTWLANWMNARGEDLKKGQFVASGSCTGITEADPDDLVTVRFGSTMQASVEFFFEDVGQEGVSS